MEAPAPVGNLLVMENNARGFSSPADLLPSLSPLQNDLVRISSEIVEESSTKTPRSEHQLVDYSLSTGGFEREIVRINTPPSPSPKRVNFSPLPSPSHLMFNESPSSSLTKGKPSMKGIIPKLSIIFRNPNAELDKAAIPTLRSPPGYVTSAFSISRLFAPRIKRTSSVPALPIIHSNPESTHGGDGNSYFTSSPKGVTFHPIHRSHSVPALFNKDGSIRQNDFVNGAVRILHATPRVADHNVAAADVAIAVGTDGIHNDGEDIPQEEAVCRICMVELGEGSGTLKMECNCKGELALAHQECAVKWFSIKGNKTCDVCNHEVQNLPVTLLRLPNGQAQGSISQTGEITQYRVWQDVPVLVIVSMLAYFCFLEQLLVTKMGSGAIAISLPFSCILGLLASMTSTTMVKRQYAWIYASTQFAMVVLFAHIFYLWVHAKPILIVILASFTGFGGAMCGTALIFEMLKLWRSWHSQTNTSEEAIHHDQTHDDNQTEQLDPELQRYETVSIGIGRGS